MKLYDKNFQKIMKPLKRHPTSHLIQNPKIIRQIARYQVNKNFYDNNIDDADIDPETNYDR